MVLAIDIGNSDVVQGIFDGEECTEVLRVPSSDEKTAENYALDLETFFLEKSLDLSKVQKVVISSVVPLITPQFEKLSKHLLDIQPLVINEMVISKLPLSINNAHEIGSDLVANCIAARELFASPAIIVDFGTALTFTVIDGTGKILGVAIAPGLRTAFETLFLNTAKLPEVPFEVPDSVFGSDTVHAIQAGVFYGYEGMVRGIIEKIRNEKPDDYKILATGGLADKLEDLNDLFDIIDSQLTLKGIFRISQLA